MNPNFRLRAALACGWLVSSATIAVAPAVAQQRVAIDIPAQSAAKAITKLGRITGTQIMFDYGQMKGVRSNAVRGTTGAREALQVMLRGTPFEAAQTASGALVVRPIRTASLTPAQAELPASEVATAQPGQSPGDDPAMDAVPEAEIVVTARKSSERVQDVPISITAMSGRSLRDRGAFDIQDVLRSVPGMSNSGAERGLSRYTIRGLSTYASSPTTGIYLDDVSLVTISTTFSGGFDPVLFDMQRIEVLKGPQGTLYGGSAMGGAIKYVSVTPDLDRFGVDGAVGAAVTAHGSPSYHGEAVINAPIVAGKLALRAGFYYRHEGGYVDAEPGIVQTTGLSSTPFPIYTPLRQDALSTRDEEDINYSNTYAVRASLEWQPDESWSIRPQIFHQNYKQADNSHFFLGREGFVSSFRFEQPTRDKATVYSLNIQKDLGDVQLTSLTSQFDRRFSYVRDYSFFIGSLVPIVFPFTSYNLSDSDTSTFSQEFRIGSNKGPGSRLKWIVGAYYSSQDDRLVQSVDAPGTAPIFGTETLYFGDTFTNTKQYALFGEATYTLFDRLDITAGVRIFKVKQLVDAINDGPFNGGLTQVDGREGSEDGVNPKFGLSYRFTPDNMVFASAAKGFRPGGPNRYPINPAVCGDDLAELGLTDAPDTYESDNLWTYEAGSKNMFGNGRITLNASAYLTKWKKIQQQIGLACGFGFNANVGSAEIKGFELEGRFQVLPGLELGGTAAYTHTEVTDAAAGTGAENGDALPEVPKWMATAFAGYSTEVGDGWDLSIRGEYQYQSKAAYSFDETFPVTFSDGVVGDIPTPFMNREAYDVVNLYASIGRGGMRFRLYANNILDARPLLDADTATGSDRARTIRPRTIGVELSKSF
ncbi:TonB-dependent receptor [Sphingosinicella rhizophila]|uniref:TonB-dependent receptor n=1 Tax=Sphingosinicella rhizophila TaxID=3050082 RepID=A0ABU3QB82_9SPHN|nr:TonB-dependent receptor [Sphingosinicella sp. GR2756]MDT9600629.1 TonB-dependent receptor [Sphingosinicella sp. GR2756]